MFGYPKFLLRATGYMITGFGALMAVLISTIYYISEASGVESSPFAAFQPMEVMLMGLCAMLIFASPFLNTLHFVFFPKRARISNGRIMAQKIQKDIEISAKTENTFTRKEPPLSSENKD